MGAIGFVITFVLRSVNDEIEIEIVKTDREENRI